jgi:hypothetical protein
LRPQACARGRRTGRGPPIPAPETEAFEELHPCGRCRPPRGGSSSPRGGMPERGPFAFSIPSPLMSASRAPCGRRGERPGPIRRLWTLTRAPSSDLPALTALSVPGPSPGSRETPVEPGPAGRMFPDFTGKISGKSQGQSRISGEFPRKRPGSGPGKQGWRRHRSGPSGSLAPLRAMLAAAS